MTIFRYIFVTIFRNFFVFEYFSSGFRLQYVETHSKTFPLMTSRAKMPLTRVIQSFIGVPCDDFSLHFLDDLTHFRDEDSETRVFRNCFNIHHFSQTRVFNDPLPPFPQMYKFYYF